MRLFLLSVMAGASRNLLDEAPALLTFGVRGPRIVSVHVLPNLVGSVVAPMTLNVANNILLESSLTFVGLASTR